MGDLAEHTGALLGIIAALLTLSAWLIKRIFFDMRKTQELMLNELKATIGEFNVKLEEMSKQIGTLSRRLHDRIHRLDIRMTAIEVKMGIQTHEPFSIPHEDDLGDRS